MGKNRSIEQKKLKIKRRGRFAKFSGATSKYAVRIDRGRYEDVVKVGQEPNEDWVPTGKHVTIAVGPISLSKAVMSTGRGPDAERMQEYYQRVHSYDQSLPRTLGLSEPMKELMKKYDEVLRETPREMHINLVNNHSGRLDLFFGGNQFFFVDIDVQQKKVRRSRVYGSRDYAMKMLKYKTITWVETISSRKVATVSP